MAPFIRSEEEAEALQELMQADSWNIFIRVLDRLVSKVQYSVVEVSKEDAISNSATLTFARGEGEGARRLASLIKDLRPHMRELRK